MCLVVGERSRFGLKVIMAEMRPIIRCRDKGMCSYTPQDRILPTSRVIHSYFSCFEPVSLPFLKKLISQMKPAMCSLDFIPTKFLKEVIDTVGPSILLIINSSLKSGTFPHSFKHAVVQPLLKKPNLDTSVLYNFRPILRNF